MPYRCKAGAIHPLDQPHEEALVCCSTCEEDTTDLPKIHTIHPPHISPHQTPIAPQTHTRLPPSSDAGSSRIVLYAFLITHSTLTYPPILTNHLNDHHNNNNSTPNKQTNTESTHRRATGNRRTATTSAHIISRQQPCTANTKHFSNADAIAQGPGQSRY